MGFDFWKMKEYYAYSSGNTGRCVVDSSAGEWKPFDHAPTNLAVFGDGGLFHTPQGLSEDRIGR